MAEASAAREEVSFVGDGCTQYFQSSSYVFFQLYVICLLIQDTFVPETNRLQCRFYENQYPEPEEVVICNVTDISELGAYVTLVEYDNIQVCSELAAFTSSFFFFSWEQSVDDVLCHSRA